MKRYFLLLALLLFSCNQNDSEEQANKEFYFSPAITEAVEHTMTPSGNYVDLQIKLHSAYTLLKALNSGVITQEEYDKLKKELI